MDFLRIAPILHPLHAQVRVPGSKSLTNRALVVSALAEGTTCLTHALFSDDTRYCAEALRQLGFSIELDPEADTITIAGLGGRIPAQQAELFIGNAGTAARFLTALLSLGQGDYVLDGEARMRERPMADLLNALRQLGVQVESATGCLPVRVRASGLPGGAAAMAGDVSSQFLSGLLVVAPYAQRPVELIVERELNSKPYVDLTLSVMADFGVSVEREDYHHFRIAPQRYRAQSNYSIESDASSASYFFAAPAVLGGQVRVENISRRSQQADLAFLDVLAKMGCRMTSGPTWVEVAGPPSGKLSGLEVDLRDFPDTAQTLAAIAPFAHSPTRIRGIASARVKETDRITALCGELARLGVAVTEHPDGLTIQPCAQVRRARIRTYNDHRMAMAFALVGLRVPGIEIENPGCVSKTFPNYFEVLEQLRCTSLRVES